jgi:hypothetical protein
MYMNIHEFIQEQVCELVYMLMYILKLIFMFIDILYRCLRNYSFKYHSREIEKLGIPYTEYRGIPGTFS